MSGGVFERTCRPLQGESRDLTPGGEAGLQQPVVLGGREQVTAGAEVVRDRTEGTKELLGVLR